MTVGFSSFSKNRNFFINSDGDKIYIIREKAKYKNSISLWLHSVL
jgi:hypothetical protein